MQRVCRMLSCMNWRHSAGLDCTLVGSPRSSCSRGAVLWSCSICRAVYDATCGAGHTMPSLASLVDTGMLAMSGA